MAFERSSIPALSRVFVLGAALATAGGLAQPAIAQDKNPFSSSASAEQRFFEGQKLYAEQKYHEALEHFRASFDLLPSPNSQLYVARCFRELGQHADAYEAYSAVLSATNGSAKYEATNKAATEEREALAAKVGRLTIEVPPGVSAKVRIGRRTIDASMFGREIVVDAGVTNLHAESAGREPFEWRGIVPPGGSQRVQIDFGDAPPASTTTPPPPPAPDNGGGSPLRTLAVVSAGVGVLGLSAFAFFGVKAANRFADLDEQCSGRCGPRDQDKVDAGRRETTISNVGLVLGIAGVGGAVALWVLGSPSPEPRSSGAVTLRVSPRGASVGGAF